MRTFAGSWRGLELFIVLWIVLTFGYSGCSSESTETFDPGDISADGEIAEEEDATIPADNDSDISPADSDEIENVEDDTGEEVEPEEEETETEEESPPTILLEMYLDALDFGEHLANEPKSMASFVIANTGQVTATVHLPDIQDEALEIGGFEDQTELAAGENLQVAVHWSPSQGSVDTNVAFSWSADGVEQAPLQLPVTGTAVDPARSFAGIVMGLFPGVESDETVQSPLKGAVVSLEGVAETKITDAHGRFVFSSLPTGRSEALVTVRAEDSVFGAFSTFRQKVDLEHRKTLRIVLQQYAEELMPVVEGVASYPVGGWEGASFELDSASLAESTTRRDDVTEIGAAVFDPSALPSDFNGTGVPLAVMYVRPFHVTLDPPLSITIPNDWNLPGSSRIAIWMLDDAEDASPSWNKLGYLVLDPAAAYWSTSEGTAISSTGVLAFTLENAETYTVSGRVLDAEGSAIEGAHVDLIAPYSHSTLTDATGMYRFTFQAGEGVPVHIAAYAENVMDGSYTSDSVVLGEPLTPSFPDLYLTDGETGTVAGLVRYDDGSLCPLCLVTATSVFGLQVMDIADENGLFRFDNIPAGDVHVTAHDLTSGVTESFDGVLPANEFLIVSLIVEAGDTVPPKIVATYPGAGQTGIRAETTLRAAFSEAMNTSGFSLAAVTLERLSNADGVPSLVGGSVSAEGERTLVFVPDAPLEIGFYYRFTITTNVEDIAGNHLQEEKIVKFRTVAPSDCVDHPAWPCLIQYFDWETGACRTGFSNGDCSDGNACTVADTCQEGVCVPGSLMVCNALDTCHDVGVCDPGTGECSNPAKPDYSSCDDGVFCTIGETCIAGVCTNPEARDCREEVEFDEPRCQMAVCDEFLNTCVIEPTNEGLVCNDGDLCTRSDTCEAGTCVGSSPVICEASGICHEVGICNPPTGLCSNPLTENGTACDDGNPETGGDSCQGGLCLGTDCTCTGINTCCDGCLPVVDSDESACNDDDACTENDTCNAGACHGEPVVCDPEDACHFEGICDPSTGNCSSRPKPFGTLCDDSDLCTYNDICTQDGCQGTAVECEAIGQCHLAGVCNPETGACTTPKKPDNSPCHDGDFCTLLDVCVEGQCVGGDSVVCTALDACHDAGICDTETGRCSNPIKADETPCNDGNLCTQTDICVEGICRGNDPVTCLPSDQCHNAGQCDLETGVCSNPAKPDGAQCQDGSHCTENDACLAGICESGPAMVCEAFDDCHVAGVCDEEIGRCTNPTADDGTTCDDGNSETEGDTCQGGICLGGGCTCAGVNPCCNGCHPVADSDGLACQDGDACTESDVCSEGICVGEPVDCDDDNLCTDNWCDSDLGCQEAYRNGILCSDGDACTLDDVCFEGICQPGNPFECQENAHCESGACYCDEGFFLDTDTNTCVLGRSHIEVDPSSCVFGQVPYNTTEPELRFFHVSNSGTADLTVEGFSFGEGCEAFRLSTSDELSLPVLIPAGGGQEEFVIEYMPVQVDEANQTVDVCTVTMLSDCMDIPEWPIPLSGTPIAPLLKLSLGGVDLDPGSASISFGEILAGATSGVDKTLIVKNEGRLALEVGEIRFGGNTSQYFSFTPSLLSELATGEYEEIRLSFGPMMPGSYEGALILETNDAREAYRTMEIQLTGLAIEPPALVVTPNGTTANPVDLGDVLQHACSDPRNIRVTNLGTSELEVVAVRVLNHFGGVASNWEIHSIDPELPVFLSSDPEDELAFYLTFCPNGWMTRQDMILGICSNDPDDVRVRPGSDDPDEPNACPEGYGWREVYFRGDGMACAAGWHDLDDDPTDCEYECTETLNRVEYCDGLDNDCNGVVDDDYPVGIQYCDDPDANPEHCCDPDEVDDPDCCEGVGVCGVGVWECDPVSKLGVICSSDIGGSEYFRWYTPEFCDGLDNDCDGQTDEDWNVGDWCVGEGECGLGQIECASSSSTRCSVNPGGSDYDASAPIRREVCDGRDNDCDGEIDNGTYFIREDVAGICDNCIDLYCRGEGSCQAGVFRCDISDPNQLTVYCTANEAGVEYELCNSQDDDCDSEIDEVYKAPNNVCPVQVAVDGTNMVYLGCTCQGIGQCGKDYSGAVPTDVYGDGQCDPDDMYGTLCSTSPGGAQDRSTEEVCDGIDNDCDGEIDEDFHINNDDWPCYAPGQCGVQYIDEQQVPRTGVWECDPYGSGERICSTGIGGSEYPQVSSVEICDDIDNDCNGEVDDIPGLHVGQFCVGTGECRYLTGVLECKTPSETQCSVDPGGSEHEAYPINPDREEICDELDNDCDGAVDNGFSIGSHCLGTGECADGILECDAANPRQTVCSTLPGGSQYYPNDEVCDGIDNDCDGKTDEDFIPEGAANKCRAFGTCGMDPETEDPIFGRWECDTSDPNQQNVICSTAPGGSDYNPLSPSREERCDGLDNDCDGEIDENCSE